MTTRRQGFGAKYHSPQTKTDPKNTLLPVSKHRKPSSAFEAATASRFPIPKIYSNREEKFDRQPATRKIWFKNRKGCGFWKPYTHTYERRREADQGRWDLPQEKISVAAEPRYMSLIFHFKTSHSLTPSTPRPLHVLVIKGLLGLMCLFEAVHMCGMTFDSQGLARDGLSLNSF